MAREKIAFILNPNAGSNRNKDRKGAISRYLDLKRYDPVFRFTKRPKHAGKIAKQLLSEGYKKIVAVGGDGTVNEVATALIGENASLGIIPVGSGNGLARFLKIPLRLPQAVRLLNDHHSRLIDAGKMNDYWFFCTCGVGFDARVGHKFSKSKKRGFGTYLKTVLREFRNYKPRKYKFVIDTIAYTRRAFLITIANAGQYGNDAYIAPGAIIDDGWFDVCILKPFPLARTLFLGLRLFNRSIEKTSYMEVIRGKQIMFEKPKKKYIFHFDGEPVKFKKIKIRISMHHHCLSVLTRKNGSENLKDRLFPIHS
jgi:diacylglycerol kinase (ATP)